MPYTCEAVGLDYFDAAPFRFTASEEIAVSAERVFELFLDAESWTRWVMPINRVEWTSSFPLEVGGTRTVFMKGGMTGYEEFIAWDPPRRMAFRFNETTRPGVDAFAEDYQVTDLGDDRCRIDWVMAITPNGVGRYTMPVMRPLMAAMLRRTLAKFTAYAESNPTIEARQAST